MGVHRITSAAAKSYAARERVIGKGITVLGTASEKASGLDKKSLEMAGDIAAELVPQSPGYAGKILQISARLFWSLAGIKEKEADVKSIDDIDAEITELEKCL